jgi:membrane-associated phospholipid phosphatase
MSGHAYTAEGVRARRSPRPPDQPPSVLRALGLAALCVVAMALIYLIVVHVPAARTRDARVLHDFTDLYRPWIDTWGSHVLHLLEPLRYTLWGIAIVAFAIARGQPRTAFAVAIVLTFAPLSAEVLKPLLAHHHEAIGRVRVGDASWPSGHATAALTVVLCALLVCPARWRLAAGLLGAAYVIAVGLALLILAWHMPSDVVGGYLLATLWIALAVAGLRIADRRWPARAG